MHFKALLTTTAACIAAATAVPANAATLLFELTGPSTASFSLESDPVVPDVNSPGVFDQIQFNNVPITVNGISSVASSIRFNRAFGGSLVINGTSLGVATFTGPRLFTRANGEIFFNEGDFDLQRTLGGGNFQLSIAPAEVAAAVPEPGTWAMMLLGFGFVGGAMRSAKRRQKLSVSYA